MRFCNECNRKTICKRCNVQINENKEFEPNLNLLKRQTPIEFGRRLPYFKKQAGLIYRILYILFPSFYFIVIGQFS